MKYIVLLCDGMADYPVAELNGKTPLEAAKTPNMDRLARESRAGLIKTVDDSMMPGSDVANLSVLGYDPHKYYTGRSPLEAGSIGIDMLADDIALRCNLVTVSAENSFEDKTLVDYCAGDISTYEARQLIEAVQQELGDHEFRFYAGVSYRHCLIWHNGTVDLGGLTPPHDITGRCVRDYIPKHDNAQKLYALMEKSCGILKNHPINTNRLRKGLRPANCIWLWGEGKRAELDSFEERYGAKASMISAVDLLKGIGKFTGMNVVYVEGATGYTDTNFKGKMQAAADELKNGSDMVYIHIEAPDECGHRGEIKEKVRAIELIDSLVLDPLLDALEIYKNYKVLILPDHATPLSLRTHTNDPVPYLLFDRLHPVKGIESFSEKNAALTGDDIAPGHILMGDFLKEIKQQSDAEAELEKLAASSQDDV